MKCSELKMGPNFSGNSSSKAFSSFSALGLNTEGEAELWVYFHVCFPESGPFLPGVFLLISLLILSRKNPNACLHTEGKILLLSFQKYRASYKKSAPTRFLPV